VADWLRISLREWTDELLSEERLRRHDYFDVKRVRALWDAHRSGKVNAQTRLWSILMFQAWHAQWME
jgi:asparagine synthase (glutamine-hydrolysing)